MPSIQKSIHISRILKLPNDYSFFIFGVRGSGKSTLLETIFEPEKSIYINLLEPEEELRFLNKPSELKHLVLAASTNIQFIIIDEIQKIPKLLDVVHLLLETYKSDKIFVMTGSSAKQLKAAGINLLAGRAFTYNLFPFSYLELNNTFDLATTLAFGMLPKLFSFTADEQKIKFLQTYTTTYLKEEIWASHLVKDLEHFRRFLEVAAQSNGKIINYSNIARDVMVTDKTVKSYFSLLEDTLIGFFLEPFHHSFRKRLRSAPKFYYIDLGIARALSASLSNKPLPSTSYYGDLFEAFIIVECFKLKHYYKSEYKLSYLQTLSDAEIDLIIERPGLPTVFIKIKSKNAVIETDLTTLLKLSADFGNCEAICLSQDPRKKKIQHVTVYPWQKGIEYIFLDK